MMETKYGDTTIYWDKSAGLVTVNSAYYNHEHEWEYLEYRLSLFEFLSRMGVTLKQVERAFAEEDQE